MHKGSGLCSDMLYKPVFPVKHAKAFPFLDLLYSLFTGFSWRAFLNMSSVPESLSPSLFLRNPENRPLSKKNSYYSFPSSKAAVVADQEPLQNGIAIFFKLELNLLLCLLLHFYLAVGNMQGDSSELILLCCCSNHTQKRFFISNSILSFSE